MLREDLRVRRAVEWLLAREHLVGEHAERILVREACDLLVVALLGTHVVRSADRGPGRRQVLLLLLLHLGDTEVGHDRPAVLVDHDVRRFDVPVNDMLLVSVGERAGDLREDHLRHGQIDATLLRDHGLERAALDELHDEVDHRLRLFDRVDLDDVRVAQARGRLRLALEARYHARARHELRQHGLDRDLAVQREVEREIHGRHATTAELPIDVVFPERRLSEQLGDHVDAGDFDGERLSERLTVSTPDTGNVRAAVRAEIRRLLQGRHAARAGEASFLGHSGRKVEPAISKKA